MDWYRLAERLRRCIKDAEPYDQAPIQEALKQLHPLAKDANEQDFIKKILQPPHRDKWVTQEDIDLKREELVGAHLLLGDWGRYRDGETIVRPETPLDDFSIDLGLGLVPPVDGEDDFDLEHAVRMEEKQQARSTRIELDLDGLESRAQSQELELVIPLSEIEKIAVAAGRWGVLEALDRMVPVPFHTVQDAIVVDASWLDKAKTALATGESIPEGYRGLHHPCWYEKRIQEAKAQLVAIQASKYRDAAQTALMRMREEIALYKDALLAEIFISAEEVLPESDPFRIKNSLLYLRSKWRSNAAFRRNYVGRIIQVEDLLLHLSEFEGAKTLDREWKAVLKITNLSSFNRDALKAEFLQWVSDSRADREAEIMQLRDGIRA